MPLTPQMIQAMNAATGNNVSLDPSAPPTRAQQIRSLGKADGGPTGDAVAPNIGTQALDVGKNYVKDVAGDYADAADKITKNLTSIPPNAGLGAEIEKGFQTTGDIAGAAVAPIAEAPGIKQAGEGMNEAGKNIAAQLMKIPAYADFFGRLSKALDAHPEIAKDLGATYSIGSLGLGGEGAGESAAAGLEKGIDLAGKAKKAMTPPEGTSMMGPTVSDGPGFIEKAQLAATKGNQISTLESAAQKGIALPGEETIRDAKGVPITAESAIKSPLERYDEHVASQESALKDAKADTALGAVGSKIGDAFDSVVKQRRDAGEKMSNELEKIGDKSTDASGAISKFNAELTKNGIAVDPEEGLMRSKTSKVTESDKDLLSQYHDELQSLGSNPTIAHLDAFLSRIPDEINVYKAKNNIIGSTNGERIIKNNLKELRSQFEPGAGKGYLKDYSTARAKYADLSRFLDEGVSHLGKKTQSGDYAKDASIAKSSVQSMLNNGKKDWLIQLEKHSGYPAIDDATLALQAMKDTGDYRGASLLESLTQGATKGELPHVPTTGTGIVNALAGRLLKKGTEKFTGTPVEQTRRFLQSLKK